MGGFGYNIEDGWEVIWGIMCDYDQTNTKSGQQSGSRCSARLSCTAHLALASSTPCNHRFPETHGPRIRFSPGQSERDPTSTAYPVHGDQQSQLPEGICCEQDAYLSDRVSVPLESLRDWRVRRLRQKSAPGTGPGRKRRPAPWWRREMALSGLSGRIRDVKHIQRAYDNDFIRTQKGTRANKTHLASIVHDLPQQLVLARLRCSEGYPPQLRYSHILLERRRASWAG